ncbi:12897_t:CDS:2, partial [Entrophospora sp. SA101]
RQSWTYPEKGEFLRPNACKRKGYILIGIKINGIYTIHSSDIQVFIPNPENKPTHCLCSSSNGSNADDDFAVLFSSLDGSDVDDDFGSLLYVVHST